MKPTFHHRLINSGFEDPSLFVRMLRQRRAFLFDAGRIDRLSAGDLLKINDVFVTHMHIDHFIGFDTLLRALLKREVPLRVYGPEEIINCVEGKLRGYTWNLIEEYPIEIEVFGISRGKVRHSSFHAQKSFARIDREEKIFDGTALKDPPYTVKAACLSHGVPCLGFSLEEDFHINIDKAGLNAMNLPVGPWLSDLKQMIRDNAAPDTRLRVDGREFNFSDLSHLAAITEGQKVSYVTDVSPEEDNLTRVAELAQGSDTFYCEAYFLHDDRDRAVERHHLTAKMAGEIARRAKVRNLVVMHFSPKYRDQANRIEEEAMKAYECTRGNF
jgi:ribonuclease Z